MDPEGPREERTAVATTVCCVADIFLCKEGASRAEGGSVDATPAAGSGFLISSGK